MITFYPGPSKIYPEVAKIAQNAFDTGILEMNHRSQVFMDLLAETKLLLHQQLNIPLNFHIALTSSSTECWEIINQSLVQNTSHHFFNGSFGEKWFQYSQAIKPATQTNFGINETLPYLNSNKTADVFCITQNETSNGTQVSMQNLWLLKGQLPESNLIAVDATSSMAGIELEWHLADVWFASVQKCFGLPAGLALMIYSEKALQRAKQLNERNHYNSLVFMHENFQKNQTPYTPNILGIYLLNNILKSIDNIEIIALKTKNRANDFYAFIEKETNFKVLINNEICQSETVIVIKDTQSEETKLKALESEIIIGNGYGELKSNTFRIANFPAISDNDFETLKRFLKSI